VTPGSPRVVLCSCSELWGNGTIQKGVKIFDLLTNRKGISKGIKSAVDSCIKLIRDRADLPHHSTVISIVERVK
jgi:hypothetical protein